MKKIILFILTILAMLGLLFKLLNINKEWNSQDFLEYVSEVPQIEITDTISSIESNWGIFNPIKSFLNLFVTLANFTIRVITNIINVLTHIIYIISYFFNITTNYYNPGNGARGGR